MKHGSHTCTLRFPHSCPRINKQANKQNKSVKTIIPVNEGMILAERGSGAWVGWARGAWAAVGGTGGPTNNRREAGRLGVGMIQKSGLRGLKWAWSTG